MQSRREVIKKAVYITPVILTLIALPSFAAKGSYVSKRSAGGNSWWSWLFPWE